MEESKTIVRKSGAAVLVQRMVRRIVCQHNWTLHSRERYAVTRMDGSKEGEVTLTLMECSKCGKDWLMPSDRTHSPNAKPTNRASTTNDSERSQ